MVEFPVTEQAEINRAINCTNIKRPQNSLSDRLHGLLNQSISEATKRAYRSDLEAFRACGGIIPSTPQQIAEYVASMAGNLKPATIARRLVAIGKAHQVLGHDNPVDSEIVKASVKGFRRVYGTAQTEAKPLLKEDLFDMLAKMGDRPKDIRDTALLLIGFAGGFRRSELVALDVDDIEHVR